ncbi:DUF1990 family protein [Rathayibacter toxicus]|uniref:DUF1990 family protein n=1 Tax=Rathayibacter toxicus TaxID=145458 RepID=UPI0024819C3D|nr:DUF1990 family protein [Rathayibacter toxicus]
MSIRRSTFEGQPQVTYAAVGGTLAPDLLEYPPKGYRAERFEARLGSGNERFAVAAASLMTWGVQRGSGLQVTDISPGSGVHYTGVNFDADGTPIDLSSRPTEEHFAPRWNAVYRCRSHGRAHDAARQTSSSRSSARCLCFGRA